MRAPKNENMTGGQEKQTQAKVLEVAPDSVDLEEDSQAALRGPDLTSEKKEEEKGGENFGARVQAWCSACSTTVAWAVGLCASWVSLPQTPR